MPENVAAAKVAALILAAGASTRLGRPKQLIVFEGESLLRRTARMALLAGAAPVYVIVPTPPVFDAALDGLPVTILPNPNAPEGMSSSLRLGMAALPPDIERVLLLVCDQPLLRLHHMEALLAAPGTVAAAQYAGRLGVPAVFSRQHFAALGAVTGDQGARSLLRTLPVTPVPMPEAATDLDTPEDLRALQPQTYVD